MRRIVVLGATGNSGSVVAETLLQNGRCIVRVVGRDAARLGRFARLGAEVFEGSIRPEESRTPQNTTPTSFEWFVEHKFLPTFAKRTQTTQKA